MDILTHVASGALAGSVLALGIRGGRARVLVSMAWGALGGFLPDVDAASRLPGFDEQVGSLLHLQPGRVIYAGSEWYSHHHFTHSLMAGAGVALVLAAYLVLERVLRGSGPDGERSVSAWLAPLCLLVGFLAHLAGDLVTPASVWGGIQLLWPSPRMVGGWGWTWWFNNYDVFLVQLLGLGLVLIGSLIPRTRPILVRLWPLVVWGISLTGSAALLATRHHGFAYSGDAPDYWALEAASLEEQQRLLPGSVYGLMRSLDENIPLPF